MKVAAGHLEDLRRSGLSDDTIQAAGFYSAPERQVHDVLGYGAGPGLVIPYPSLNGSAPYARVKLDKPGPDGKKYRSPMKQPNRLYIPALLAPAVLTDARTAIWLTEGEKKVLKACQEGLPCIGVSGVWSWRTRAGRDDGKSVPLPDLDHIIWKGRTVYIAFDSDLATNRSVKFAEFAFTRELARRGAKVFAVRLPGGPAGEKVGLDDYLLTHTVESLCAIEPVEIQHPAARSGPLVLEAHDLLRREYAQQPAIVGGGVLVRQGFGITGGVPKLGKTALETNKMLCRSLGRPWLGFPTTPGRTLLIQAEIPERELQTRLRLMASDLDVPLPNDKLFFVTYRGLRVDQPAGLQVCRKLIEEVKADWLILDPLARFYGGDENSAREVGRLIAGLDALIQDLGIAVELVHHTSKPSLGDPREGGLRLRGSSALFAAADSVLLLDRDDDAFKLSFELRHGKTPEPMRLTRNDRLWFTLAGPPEDLLAVAEIVRLMPMRYGTLIEAIRQDMKISERSAARLVDRAKKFSAITKDADGRYYATATHCQATAGSGVSADRA